MDALLAFQNPIISTLHHLANLPDEAEKAFNSSSRAYVQDAKAIAWTPADVRDLPAAYEFIVDMPGVKSGEISVQIEDDNVLVISGERRREEGNEKDERAGKFLRIERRMGKFMRRFSLPENANAEAISAVYRDGVLVVSVEKRPPAALKKRKTIEVK